MTKPSTWTALLNRIAAEVSIGPDGFTAEGHEHTVPPDMATTDTVTKPLSRYLYDRYYLGRTAVTTGQGADRRPAFAREDPAFGRRLRAASGGRVHWDRGWQGVSGFPGPVVRKAGLRLTVDQHEVRAGSGGTVEVRFPADRPFASPGFFLTIGTSGAGRPTDDLVRCYLNVIAASAPKVFGELVGQLEGGSLAYTMKVLNDPAAFDRPDALVMYLGRADLDRIMPFLIQMHAAHRRYFRATVPAFTSRVLPGIALADEPPPTGRPTSFGQHRCALIARGLIAAGTSATAAVRLESIRGTFSDDGFDVDRPYLNPDSADFPGRTEWFR